MKKKKQIIDELKKIFIVSSLLFITGIYSYVFHSNFGSFGSLGIVTGMGGFFTIAMSFLHEVAK